MQYPPLGLYYKLRAPHRPTSMQTSVIKRRKRVLAALGTSASAHTSPPANTRLTERATAKALVSVSRVQERASGEDSGADDGEDEEEDELRRKRVRRGTSWNTAAASLARRRKGSQCDIFLAESRAGSLSRSSSRVAFHADGATLPIRNPSILFPM